MTTRRRMNPRWLPCTSLWALAACTQGAAQPEAAPLPRSSAETRWVAARAPAGLSLLELPAHVLAAPQSLGAVSAPYQARVVKVLVQAGQRLKSGDPTVEVIMPAVTAAAGAYLGARTRFEAYARRKAQLDRLRADGLVRLSEIAEVETHLAESRADEHTALATLRSAGLRPTDASRILGGDGTVMLRSPIGGVITEADVVVGEVREPGGKPFVRVAAQAAPRIEARLSHAMPAGAGFEFVANGWSPVELRAIAQAPQIDRRDGTRLSWFEPLKPTPLPHGLSGKLAVHLHGDRVVAVPAPAVVMNEGHAEVITRDGARLKRVPVVVLLVSGADALVEGPVRPGHIVAADGALATAGLR